MVEVVGIRGEGMRNEIARKISKIEIIVNWKFRKKQ